MMHQQSPVHIGRPLMRTAPTVTQSQQADPQMETGRRSTRMMRAANPSWLSFTDNGDGTATLTGTPELIPTWAHTPCRSAYLTEQRLDSASFDHHSG